MALLLGLIRPPSATSTVQVVEARRAAGDCSLARVDGFSSRVSQCPAPGYFLGFLLNAAVIGGAGNYFLGPKLGLIRALGAGSQVHAEDAHINAGAGAAPGAYSHGFSPKMLKDGGVAQRTLDTAIRQVQAG